MKLAIVANTTKEGTRTILPRFLELCAVAGVGTVLHEELKTLAGSGCTYAAPPALFEGADMIISFGGDGTILHTARLSAGYGVPILGVNLGKVGFLAEIAPDEIDDIPERLLAGDYEILERLAFTAETESGKSWFALNDIVLDRNTDTRILGLAVTIDGGYAGDFHADGFIVSTPTGSTAHAMAAGGPLVMPDCEVLVLAPICPHSLTMRPLIVPGGCEVIITVTEGDARLAVDGQSFVAVPAGGRVVVRRADHPVRVARFRDKTYFDILHTRLRWGVSLKLKNA